MIKKTFYNNDIYFMKRIGNIIIINNNYESILFLDSELNVIKDEKLLDDLLIDDCFINQETKEIMFYAYENHCFIYLDTINNIKKIIHIPKEFEELYFYPVYEWKCDKLYLLADAGKIILCIDILKGLIREIPDNTSSRFNNFKLLTSSNVRKINENIVLIEQERELKVINWITGQVKASYLKYNEHFNDIEVNDKLVAFISENKIMIYNQERCLLKLTPLDNFCFLRGLFLIIDQSVYFYTLSSCNSDCSYNLVERYILDKG